MEATKPNPLPPLFSLDSVRYPGETKKTEKLMKDPQAMKLLQEIHEKLKSDARKTFLMSAVRLTPSMCPSIFEVCNTILATLRLEPKLEIYVRQSPDINAGCVAGSTLQEDSPLIVLSSALMEKMSPDELLFVLGHEIGHWVYKHHKYSVPNIMQFQEASEYPYQSMQIMSLSRAAEISSDRVGLLACQNFTTAVRTFFKLASGLSSEHLVPDVKEYWQQVIEASKFIGQSDDPMGWFSTHPFNPYRLKALHAFWCFDQLRSLWKGAAPPESIARLEVERRVDAILADMDPDYLRSEHVVMLKMTEFLAWAGALLIFSDRKVHPKEMEKLQSFVGADLARRVVFELEKGTPLQKLFDKAGELSVPIRGQATAVARTQILSNLIALTLADGTLDQGELNGLTQLCPLLGLDPNNIPVLLERQGIRLRRA